MTNLERRLIDDDDGAAPASHYLPSLLIATYAGATMVAPPGRAARADHIALLPRVSFPFPSAHKEFAVVL